nr:uncharacterized protein LOC108404833 isoform X2 [Manis javanica]
MRGDPSSRRRRRRARSCPRHARAGGGRDPGRDSRSRPSEPAGRLGPAQPRKPHWMGRGRSQLHTQGRHRRARAAGAAQAGGFPVAPGAARSRLSSPRCDSYGGARREVEALRLRAGAGRVRSAAARLLRRRRGRAGCPHFAPQAPDPSGGRAAAVSPTPDLTAARRRGASASHGPFPFLAGREWAPSQPAQPLKCTTSESCDRIKEEFQFSQAQYHRDAHWSPFEIFFFCWLFYNV